MMNLLQPQVVWVESVPKAILGFCRGPVILPADGVVLLQELYHEQNILQLSVRWQAVPRC